MVNSQLVTRKRITAVLALVQVTQVQIASAEAHTLFVVEIVLGHCNRWVMNREIGTTSNKMFVFFQHVNSIQKHQLDGMLPIDNAQWQDRNWFIIRIEK